MQRTRIREVLTGAPDGELIAIAGWVRTRRDAKGGISFVEVNDGSCLANVQVVAESTLPNYADVVQHLHPGAAVRILGRRTASLGAGQAIEISATDVTCLGPSDPLAYPLGKQRISLERLRELPHLRARTSTFGAVARVRNRLSMAIHAFFQERGFLWLHTPIIATSDCEGAGELFQVTTLDIAQPPRLADGAVDYAQDFFSRRTALTVSGQIEGETYACALGDIYTFGPTFRAENSNTRRHLAEFWMVEPEMAFADLADDAALAEALLKYLFRTMLAECSEDLAFFEKRIAPGVTARLESLVEAPFPRMTYTEAIGHLRKAQQPFAFTPEWGCDLQTEHERYLTETVVRSPLIVTDYPEQIKAFYMRRNDDGQTVAAMDVLVPEVGEIIGGSQREERLDLLIDNMRRRGLEPNDYAAYLDLRRFGTMPHAGFGLGFERLVQFCTGLANIRDVIPYPRTPGGNS